MSLTPGPSAGGGGRHLDQVVRLRKEAIVREVTMTVLLMLDDADNPQSWDFMDWLSDPRVKGWEIEDNDPAQTVAVTGCAHEEVTA